MEPGPLQVIVGQEEFHRFGLMGEGAQPMAVQRPEQDEAGVRDSAPVTEPSPG